MTAPAPVAAGFWRRYAAWSLDAAIVAVPVLVLTWSRMSHGLHDARSAFAKLAGRLAALLGEGLVSGGDPLSMAQAGLTDSEVRAASASLESAISQALQPGLLCFLVVAAAYWITFEGGPWQATPGKRALGLSVTDVAGRRIGMARALARHVAGALSWLTLNLGHLLALLPPQRRALHDHVAGTSVLQADADLRLPAWARAWLALQVVATLVAVAWGLGALQEALRRSIEGLM
jgi:uncharacterized RDD family membrane protein YckC